MNYWLDLTAYRCPLPLLMAKKALSGLATGDELSLLLQNVTLHDFELLAKTLSFQLSVEKLENGQIQLCFK